jgi:hypothetical protein
MSDPDAIDRGAGIKVRDCRNVLPGPVIRVLRFIGPTA